MGYLTRLYVTLIAGGDNKSPAVTCIQLTAVSVETSLDWNFGLLTAANLHWYFKKPLVLPSTQLLPLIYRGTGTQSDVLCENSPTGQSSVSDERYDMHLTRPAQTHMECGQIRQYLVCMLATWTPKHRMKNRYTYNDMCNFARVLEWINDLSIHHVQYKYTARDWKFLF